MHRRFAMLAAALLAACAGPLDLPAEPGSAAAPHLDRLEPDVAIAALGSPILLHGTGLAGVTDVFVGPIHVRQAALTATDHDLLFHVTTKLLAAAGIPTVDGDALLVKVVSPGGTDTALDTVRVYANLATLDEITPTDLAPHQLLYLRGTGFDGDNVDDNLVALARPEVAEACATADGVMTGVGAPGCVSANVFWAAKGLVIAEVPENAPSGEVQVVYRNRQFEKLAAEAQAWRQSGRALSNFYQGGDAPTPTTTPSNSADDAAAVGGAATSTGPDSVPNDAIVWEDPGVLTATRHDATLTITGEGRLCYPSALRTDHLRVLVDGAVVAPTDVACAPVDDDKLLVTLPAAAPASPPTSHSLQVVNPYFASPVAFFTSP